MNIQQLRTLSAFLEHGSFSETGNQVGLSHSAVSVQMQQLETELNVEIFDRHSRPPTITPMGAEIAKLALGILDEIEKIRMFAAGENLAGSITIGFVPKTLQTLLPRVLKELRQNYPQLKVNVKSAISDELATMIRHQELDFAVLTAPTVEIPDIEIATIAAEPLYVIAPKSQIGINSDANLARSMPFIFFEKKTWLGQQIVISLQARGIFVDELMELDSFDVIEDLVLDGFGVSIVPQRLLSTPLSPDLVKLPFSNPQEVRRLVLARHINNQKTELYNFIHTYLASLADAVHES